MYDSAILSMPFYAITGNHDEEYKMAEACLAYSKRHPESRWKMPAAHYRVEFPADKPIVTVLMLDGGKDAAAWLKAELARPRRSAWVICCGHYPLFSNGMHGDNKRLQTTWGALFKSHNVDFYVSGHDHTLQHLEPKGWATTFLVSGGGGENAKRPVKSEDGPFCRASYGFIHLRLTDEMATVKLIDETGKTIHAFERDRKGQVRILSGE